MKDAMHEDMVSPSYPAFRVWGCGPFRVERRQVNTFYESVRTSEWGGSNYPRLLLKALLCCPGRRARREALLEMLWPHCNPEQAAQYLNTAVTKLRNVLRPGKGQESLLITEEDSNWYHLEEQPLLWFDADEALALLKEAEQAGFASPHALPFLEQAVKHLEVGTFLEGEEGFWLYSRRGDIDAARYNGRLWLAEVYTQQDMVGQAEMQLRALLVDDPTDEDVLCQAMLLLHRHGLAHKAWRLYQQISVRLAREGSALSEATRSLAEQLHAERPSALSTALNSTRVSVYAALPLSASLLPLQMEISLQEGMPVDCATWFGWKQAQLMTLIHQWSGRASFCDELQMHLQTALGALNDMRPSLPSDETYQVSRRQVLVSLATLAIGFLASGRYEHQSSLFAEEFLPRCAAGIIACQQLMKGRDFFQAEQILTHYCSALEPLMQPPSKYQQMAAYLMLQCDNALRTLASHRLQWDKSEQYGRHAIRFSLLAKNQQVRTVVLVGQASNYFNRVKPAEALDTYQQAFPLLNQVSPLIQSSFYVKRAAAYALQGQAQQARADLKQAQACFPDYPEKDSGFLYADFGLPSLFLWEGLTHLELARHGDASPQEAWDAFAQVEGTDPRMIVSERNRIEIVNYQTQAAILLGDMDRFCTYLQRGIEGAKTLSSVRRRQEALDNYRLARERWPHETKVSDMAELFIHG